MSFDLIDRKFGRRCEPISAPSPATVEHPKPDNRWWCIGCNGVVDGSEVTFEERHDPRFVGGCGELTDGTEMKMNFCPAVRFGAGQRDRVRCVILPH